MNPRHFVPVIAISALAACKKEEPPPTFPPEVPSASVTCGDASGEDAKVVEEVGITITDADRDLVPSSIHVTVNGVPIDTPTDDDADDVYTWTPPTSWNPPMVCRGIFQFIVSVRDAEGHEVQATLEVDKTDS